METGIILMNNTKFYGKISDLIVKHLDELMRLFLIMDYIAFDVPAEACESYIKNDEIATQIVRSAKDKIIELEKRVAKLDALEAFGVNNWSGYPQAMEYLEEIENESGY